MKKKEMICDYGQCLDQFVLYLGMLDEHICKHRNHTQWRRDSSQIKKALKMYIKYKKQLDFDKEEKALADFFNYVRDHIQGWWD